MNKRLLVTGLSGFVGTQLRASLEPQWQLMELPRLDLAEPGAFDEYLRDDVPDAVIHLAGQTFVPQAFRDPAGTLQVNVIGTLNLLQSLKRCGFSGAFLYVSSGDVYGQVSEDQLPVTELQLPRPRNPYGVSKLSAELLCQQWSFAEPWRMMVARPFNHVGMGQKADFVIPAVARQLARIRHGLQDACIEVGDIDVTRDFLDVRDVLSAYFALLEKGRSGEVYNVCSGQEYRVRDLIAQMAALAGVELQIRQDPQKLRKAEQRRVRGSNAKLQSETGWKPAHGMEQILLDVLADWDVRALQE
ncbi:MULTISPECIES: GDP-mannose 4,6-dehydratase [unclassified Pseudomonas]|uniref:GDP-mannose 4,6-dehydratase n=1 Tax=unclassified Pseudomonas TaxID=196821 RepID=UPI0009DB179A|nr:MULTISPECIES: GDP-mannose 4,6-dehydratase [unclassified Pseudomonas]MBD9514885.1 GDP-mannose 4,6-dehydratase [Pseudomonas sp. PDM22]MBD9685739.1 GDP-mannose 4,6-dehydratase [Pseudomonas sp. PDM20]OQR32096.1 NAD-dependent dehydratase [Pseudomonas sp. T]